MTTARRAGWAYLSALVFSAILYFLPTTLASRVPAGVTAALDWLALPGVGLAGMADCGVHGDCGLTTMTAAVLIASTLFWGSVLFGLSTCVVLVRRRQMSDKAAA
jgi:hypothetical protein